jgi:hypothetical protein
MKLGKLFSGLFKRKTDDKIEAAARMLGRNDIAIAEGMARADINNAFRQVIADLGRPRRRGYCGQG